MDGYVALYTAVSMLLAGRYFKEGRLLDLMAGIICLAMLGNIKNEGLLIVLIGMFALTATGILSREFRFADFKRLLGFCRVGWLAVILSPGIIWSVFYKSKWALTNDLQLGAAAGFDRMMNRLFDGVSFPIIFKGTFFNIESTVWLVLAAFAVSIVLLAVSRRYSVAWIPALLTASVYYGCLMMIFLLIPNDPTVCEFSSMHRTMLTTTGCLVAATHFVLRELEEASMERNPRESRNLISAQNPKARLNTFLSR